MAALLATAGNLAREREVRLSAFQVLVAYVDPQLVFDPEDLDRAPVVLGSGSHASYDVGSEPPRPDAAERIMTLLRRLGTSDADPMAPAARWLWQALVYTRPDLGAADAERLTLTAVCEFTFRITNPIPIPLLVEFEGDLWHGLSPIGVARIRTAGSAPIVCLEFYVRLLFSEGIVWEGRVLELPLRGEEIDCLVGRDFLARTTFLYDGRGNQFTLTF